MLYAHSNASTGKEDWQTLQNHLNSVAKLAEEFAACFGLSQIAYAHGILHDAGKASLAFQNRLEGSSQRVDHATAGARIALEKYGEELGRLFAYSIVGHHGGLPNNILDGERSSLKRRLSASLEPHEGFYDLLQNGDVYLPEASEMLSELKRNRKYGYELPVKGMQVFSFYLMIKMIYSCLIDADYLDTEAAMAPEIAKLRSDKSINLRDLRDAFDVFMGELVANSKGTIVVNTARASILQDCINMAQSNPGLFTLTVPTGGGKTLSSLAFALNHALEHGHDRIIYSLPYLSVVEQTARQLKRIFGDDMVLEHHSNYEVSDDSDDEAALKQRLAIQNWDAPIVVTTNVQFFESLYSNKPSRCRKLHNIANSVVILDEVQMLPDSLLMPSLAMLEELSLGYRTSIVLCTATQPALFNRWPFGAKPKELVENRKLFDEAFGKRVSFVNLGSVEEEELARRIANYDQVLCVVGTKNEARKLHKAISDLILPSSWQTDEYVGDEHGVFHLSTSLVPVHRNKKFDEIRKRLDSKERCIVISTQLIEAGVDVDFPVVFREMAGLDSIMQAAGRCNREGLRSEGLVFIFDYCVDGEISKTSYWLEQMKTIGRSTLRENDQVLDDTAIEAFFDKRYNTCDLDAKGIYEELTSDERLRGFDFSFESYAQEYQFIENDEVSVFVPWDSKGMELFGELKHSEFPASLAARLQRYTVGIPSWLFNDYLTNGFIEEIPPFAILRTGEGVKLYRNDIGLLKPGEEELDLLML